MEHNKYKEMLLLCSYNELNKVERNELDRHMLGCNSCKDELEELKKLHELVTSNISEEPCELDSPGLIVCQQT